MKSHPVVANITFPEGPAFDDRGNLYFVNYLVDGAIGRMTLDGTVSAWVHTGGSAGGLKYDGRGHIDRHGQWRTPHPPFRHENPRNGDTGRQLSRPPVQGPQ